MSKSNEISIAEAAKWMVKIASANGTITPEAIQIIDDFAKEYGLEKQAFIPEAKPPRKIEDLYRDLRAQENKRLKSQKNSKEDYKKDRIEIESFGEKKRISEQTNIASLFQIYAKLGYQVVADTNIKFDDKYPLVTLNTKSTNYTKKGCWYILSNIPTNSLAICLNLVFDTLNARMIARVITR